MCENCGKNMSEQTDYCPACKINENINGQEESIQTREEINQTSNSGMQKHNKWAIISFATALVVVFLLLMIPLLGLIMIVLEASSEITNLHKTFLRFLFILPWIINAVSLITGIIGLCSEKRKRKIFAIVGLVLSIISFLFLARIIDL